MNAPQHHHGLELLLVELEAGFAPNYAKAGDAGLDLRARIDKPFTMQRGSKIRIPTGIKTAIPAGFVGLVCPRSGMADKFNVTVGNAPGVVDANFRGELEVILTCHGYDRFDVNPKDRIAQLLIVPVMRCSVRLVDQLPDSVRGEAGFGSTGKD
jgi:dUTP pyrophosphatase